MMIGSAVLNIYGTVFFFNIDSTIHINRVTTFKSFIESIESCLIHYMAPSLHSRLEIEVLRRIQCGNVEGVDWLSIARG
jgi:hypothetical protein